MSPQERQQVIDLAQLQIHEYFDHYLTRVFPAQVKAYVKAHDETGTAHREEFVTHTKHCRVQAKLKQVIWWGMGFVAAISVLGGVAAIWYYLK